MTDVTTRSIDSRHDGASISALAARAPGETLGGVVVIQEIFGLSAHVAEMCERFAEAGYDALAPGLFDRIERGFTASHDAEGFAKGRAAVAASPWDQVAGDVQAAIDALPKPCFIAGFCYGGAVSWLAAARCTGLSAASCFYGRLIVDLLHETPRIPTLLHYGARDASIPLEQVERVRAAYPEMGVHVYDAGHGFCRKAGADYDEASCDLAMGRTLELFARWR